MSPQNRSEAELIEDKFYKKARMVIRAVKPERSGAHRR